MNFDDIRPYIDEEVPAVIENLLNNNDFIDAMLKFEKPMLKKVMPNVGRSVARKKLRKKLGGIKTIADQQQVLEGYVDALLEKSSSGYTQTGMNDSSKEHSHLFMSNHRDIVMDPAMIGYLLHGSEHGTVEIAIGDNLLMRDYVADLMRLNKSFIVKRSAKGREKLLALNQLSSYIHHCIKSKKNVWIAQREGRAKDSIDKTDPTILKMLHIANRGSEEKYTLKDSINQLHIIPVSISYEYDPCAEMKAREQYEKETKGSFEKDQNSDLNSIVTGMNGYKGHIHLTFGKEISAASDNPEEIAEQIDKQVVSNYKLFPSNYIAYEHLCQLDVSTPNIDNYEVEISEEKRKEFNDIYNNIPGELKLHFLRIYANPVLNKENFN